MVGRADAPLRVGIVDYLNSRPLAWGFRPDRLPPGIEAIFERPARVADRMARGEIDVGLLPSVEVARQGLRHVPSLGVASDSEVRSVLLVSNVEIPRIRSVALDTSSRTSAALVEILLADGWGLEPELVPQAPDLDAMLAAHDAALIIGDPALLVPRGERTLDLAAEWHRLTGLPFVFAVWAVRPGIEPDAVRPFFEASLAEGLADLDEIVRQASEELGLPAAELRSYLTENLTFRLGRREEEGLTEFLARAGARGLLEFRGAPLEASR